jgi:hypothetical protein
LKNIYNVFSLEMCGTIGTIRICRAAAANAIPTSAWRELRTTIEAAIANGARAFIWRSENPRFFSTGADIGDLAQLSSHQAARRGRLINSGPLSRIRDVTPPIETRSMRLASSGISRHSHRLIGTAKSGRKMSVSEMRMSSSFLEQSRNNFRVVEGVVSHIGSAVSYGAVRANTDVACIVGSNPSRSISVRSSPQSAPVRGY